MWEDRALDRSLSAARGRSSARARRLVDSARMLAFERGSSEFTVAEVAARADVSLRSFYRQFSGKDDLVLALFEEEARHGAELLATAAAETPEPVARLRSYVVGLCELLVTGSGYASLLLREHLRLGQRRPDDLRAALGPLIDLLETELEAAAAIDEIRAVDRHDAVLVFSAVLAHAHAAILFAPDDDFETSARRLWEFCRWGLAPDGGG
jgi:TetR/AcrR family transcriptional regulator